MKIKCVEEASRASDRNRYREIAQNLKHIKKLTGGEEKVKSTIEKFRLEYKNRHAMMEEISNV